MRRRAGPPRTRSARLPSPLLPAVVAALTLAVAGPSPATANGSDTPAASAGTQVPNDVRRAGVASYLRHLYAVYFGIRACAEMSVAANDRSLVSEVSLEEARRTLKLIDAASAEVGLDADATWTAVAPVATVTAEALKADPSGNLERCHGLGALFRTDVGNLQGNLRLLGARTLLIPKDY